MRLVPLTFCLLVLAVSLAASPLFASEIREFDLKTTERLGNELVRESQRTDRGATNSIQNRAKETAIAAGGFTEGNSESEQAKKTKVES